MRNTIKWKKPTPDLKDSKDFLKPRDPFSGKKSQTKKFEKWWKNKKNKQNWQKIQKLNKYRKCLNKVKNDQQNQGFKSQLLNHKPKF